MEDRLIPSFRPSSKGNSHLFHSGFTELAAAIVLQAVKDYIFILRNLMDKNLALRWRRQLMVDKAELEDFFRSVWCGTLTDIDPDAIIRNCRFRAIEQEKEAIQMRNKREIKRLKAEQRKAARDDHNDADGGDGPVLAVETDHTDSCITSNITTDDNAINGKNAVNEDINTETREKSKDDNPRNI